MFLANSNADAEHERKVVQALAERRVDGIIVTSSRVGSDYLPMLAQLNVPMVLVNDQYPGEFVHSVMIANEDGNAGRRPIISSNWAIGELRTWATAAAIRQTRRG